jgi:ABC-type transport system involved in multi-copper enzyme maturation permease subunit
MTTIVTRRGERTHPSWMTRFWAVVRYELLWNIRKKKFIGVVIVAFVFATIGLVLPVILSNATGQPITANPDYAVTFSAGSLGFFLFALVTAMNSISGEFESGTIVPLLTKPVSRTMVFLGKVFAAFIVILATYIVLFVYSTIGAIFVYGPQNNLQLVPLTLLGNVISTFIWVAIILAVGALSKSSLMAALGALGVFMALFLAVPIIAVFVSQPTALNYVPGSGAQGSMIISQNATATVSKGVATGTDDIGVNLVNYVLYPSASVNFTRFLFQPSAQPQVLYVESTGLILLRSVAVAAVYIFVFSLIAWYALKRAQVLE